MYDAETFTSSFLDWKDTLNCLESGVDYSWFIGNDTVEE